MAVQLTESRQFLQVQILTGHQPDRRPEEVQFNVDIYEKVSMYLYACHCYSLLNIDDARSSAI